MTEEKKDEEKRVARRKPRYISRERPKPFGEHYGFWVPPTAIAELRRMLDVSRDNLEDVLIRLFPSRLPVLREPRVDILDLGDALQIVADLPGVHKEDIEIDLGPERIEISAESSIETERKEEDYTYRERGHASYRRVLDLPVAVLPDKAEASFKNGVLELKMPKKEPTEVVKKTRVTIK